MDIIEFEARPGVDWVDGKRVPEDRIVRLTETEARFDLEPGRIRRKAEGAPAEPADAEPVPPAEAGAVPDAAQPARSPKPARAPAVPEG